jgi:uncharacterized phage protein gp47/JayE
MVDRPTLSSLISGVESDVDGKLAGADSRLRRSMLSVLARIVAGVAFALYAYVDAGFKNLFAATADDDHVREQAADYGLTPNPATFASGPVTVTGVNDTPIIAGTVLQRSDQATFTTSADATITGGTATLEVTADLAGSAGNTAVGSSLSFVSPVSGVSSSGTVAGEAGIAGGNDEESIDSLRARLQFRKRNPPQGGSEADYELWMGQALTGVTRSWVIPGWDGAGSVGLGFVFDGRDDIIPTDDDLAAMDAYVDALRPVTARQVAFAPIPSVINPVLTISPDTPTIRAAVQAELADLILREGTAEGGTILLTHIEGAIETAAGVNDYVLTSPAANVVTAVGHLPVFGDVEGW